MKIELEIELRSNNTGPWVEVDLVAGELRTNVASIPVNPHYSQGVEKAALGVVADALRSALMESSL